MQIAAEERVICICEDNSLGRYKGCSWYERTSFYTTKNAGFWYLEKFPKYWICICQSAADYWCGNDDAHTVLFDIWGRRSVAVAHICRHFCVDWLAFALGVSRCVQLEVERGLSITTFGWVVISALSALPFVLHGSIPSFTDAFMEMMSGYTTQGATILNDIEAVPHGLLLWRSETHFLGGMGFITFAVLLLPHGMGGARLFKAESSPGQVITGERFIARNRDAVNILWIIYLILNVLQILFYMVGGCHYLVPLATLLVRYLLQDILHTMPVWATSTLLILTGSP